MGFAAFGGHTCAGDHLVFSIRMKLGEKGQHALCPATFINPSNFYLC